MPCRMQDVHARRVVAMAERLHAGLPVDTDNPPSAPLRYLDRLTPLVTEVCPRHGTVQCTHDYNH